ncbi:MAG: ATP-binding cassette domain-containing protein [Streptosporangiales bacterium]|nr:ATP-binding cassette domain-containing protein [Streptosporangiales bacterium]
MTETLLDVRDVSLRFGGVRALDELSLSVTDDHHLWGLIGPNGSGKTTLFNTVSGLYQPQAGAITGSAVRRRRGTVPDLGRTFQHPRVFGQLDVIENLLAASAALRKRTAEERAEELLELLTLTHVANRRAGELSIGQQKLVELARTLMRDPKLVLLDEVAAGIHPRLRREIADHLRKLAAQGTHFLIIEHDMRFLMELCTRVFCMAHGKVIAVGSPVEIRADQRVADEYLGRGHERS